jgi:hypothetical protein
MAPTKLQEFIASVNTAFNAAAEQGEVPVMLVSPGIRRHIRAIIERFRPQTAILSQAEVHPARQAEDLRADRLMTNPVLPTSLALENGFAVVPAGLLATIETSLERSFTARPSDAYPLPAGFHFVQPDPVDLDDFKKLYRAVGDPWLWFGRLAEER